MAALRSRCGHYIFVLWFLSSLWPPNGQVIISCPVFSYIFSFLSFPSPNLSGRRLDVYHTSTHGVALVWI